MGRLLDIPFHHIDKDVTVRQLLNHTSGVPDYFDESVMNEQAERLLRCEILSVFGPICWKEI